MDRGPAEAPCSPLCQPGRDYEILPKVANVPPWVLKSKDPRFVEKPVETRKFVDDGINMSNVNMRSAQLLIEDGRYFKDVTDRRTEDLLNHIAAKAEAKGMVINQAKTGLMCISAATTFDNRVRANVGGVVVTGKDSLNILGLKLDRDCSFKTHIRTLKGKLRARTWALAKLRKRGLSTKRLVKVYKSVIRPSVEYLAPVWSPMITAEQSESLERQQVQALKNIFGPKISANKLRAEASIERLSQRREKLSLNFARKAVTNPRSSHWFLQRSKPLYAGRSSINYPTFCEKTARTDRYQNSPKNYLVRLLNKNI